MTDLAPNLPQVHLSPNALLVTPDQLQHLMAAQRKSRQTSRTSAVVGGLSGGGVALVAGTALLGPIGLLGGALVGWKLSSLITGQRSLERAREAIAGRLDWDAFVCGPAPFMKLTVAALKELEFPRSRRHQEKFVSLGGNPFGDLHDIEIAESEITAADTDEEDRLPTVTVTPLEIGDLGEETLAYRHDVAFSGVAWSLAVAIVRDGQHLVAVVHQAFLGASDPSVVEQTITRQVARLSD
jgi:hypothetical protein